MVQPLCPTGFTDIQECIEKKTPVYFLLHEGWDSVQLGWRSEQFMLFLDNGIVAKDGLVFTSDRKILKDTIPYPINDGWWLRCNYAQKRTFFDGRLVVLSSHDQHQWYHWLLQVLPRLKLLVESGIEYDKICIYNLELPWQKQSLAIVMDSLNIPSERLFIVDPDEAIEAKTLIVPSVPYSRKLKQRKILPQWLSQFLQTTFLKNDGSMRPKRIYISRSAAKVRKIVNEDELSAFLITKGFVVLHLENVSVHDQANYFHNAEVIISPHGSGLSNLVFCRPGTVVIEIDYFLRGHFSEIAKTMKCKHLRYRVDSVLPHEDFYLDIEAFKQFYNNTQGKLIEE